MFRYAVILFLLVYIAADGFFGRLLETRNAREAFANSSQAQTTCFDKHGRKIK